MLAHIATSIAGMLASEDKSGLTLAHSEKGYPPSSGTLIFCLLLLLIASLPGGLSAQEAHVARFSQLDESMPLGRHAYVQHASQSEMREWLEAPQATLQRIHDKLVHTESLDSLTISGSGLPAWRRNDNDSLYLDSPSRLNWVVLDLLWEGEGEKRFVLEMTGIDGFGWIITRTDGERVSFFDDFQARRGGRPIVDTKTAMPLQLESGEVYRLHIAAMTVTDSKYTSFNLWEEEAFRFDRLNLRIIDGAYFGLVFALVLFNLFLYLAFRQKAYLYFALFIAASAGMIYIGSGLSLIVGLQNSFPQSLALAYLFQGLVGVFGGLFSVALLNISATNKLLYRVWILVIGANLAVTPLVMYLGRNGGFSTDDVGVTFDLVVLLWLGYQLANICTLVYYWHKSRSARFWYLGVTLHTWALALWPTLLNSAIDPWLDPYHLAQIATLINTVFLSALLVHTFKSEQQSRISAQQKSVENLRLAHDEQRAKINFVATVGHDLRAPVQAISHFTQSMKHSLPESARSSLEKIDDNVANISDLIDSMIQLSRSEWRGTRTASETIALSELLAEMKSEFSARAEQKGLQLEIDSTWCEVVSDRICLSQILRNLIENAIKFTEQGFVKILIQEEGSHVRLTVEDSGQGIVESELDNIFNEFYQVESEGRINQGVGLGLSIVKRLTGLLDIQLTVRSEPGQGSRFQLKLLKVIQTSELQESSNVKELQPVAPLPGTLIGVNVLAVNAGNDKAMDALSDRLITWGAKVVKCQDFTSAWNHYARLQTMPRLIMTDVQSYLAQEPAPDQDQSPVLFSSDTPVLVFETGACSFPGDRVLHEGHTLVRLPLAVMRFRALIQRSIGQMQRKVL